MEGKSFLKTFVETTIVSFVFFGTAKTIMEWETSPIRTWLIENGEVFTGEIRKLFDLGRFQNEVMHDIDRLPITEDKRK